MTQSILATIITIHALLAGISPDYALCIVEHESKLDIVAHGDGGKAFGLWQWHEPSWKHVREKMGADTSPALRADPVESTRTALFAMSELGLYRWWSTDAGCRHLREQGAQP
jgi:hypothetical protein